MDANLKEQILQLKKEKDALIVAHYYQRPEIQDIADVIGDSYQLSKVAKESPNKVIVFCGVKFMAESAKILSPEKTVLLPVMDAGCPMADMADAEAVAEMKKKYPNAAVVCYINSTAEVKAHCDVCVTSSNALQIIEKLPQEEILFIPDENLGAYIAQKVPNKKFILWKGFCITHKKVKPEEVLKIKEIKPNVQVVAHPECEKPVWEVADFVGSTKAMIDYVTASDAKDFVVVTEEGVLHEMKKKNPDKNFFVPGRTMTCVNMKKTTLQDVYNALANMQNEIIVEDEVREKALACLEKMHEMVG